MNEESDLGHSDWSSGPNNLNPEIGSDTVSQSLAKHDLIKEISNLQSSLNESEGLLERVDKVQAECQKKKADNETLQTYVNNLTRQNMLITSAK